MGPEAESNPATATLRIKYGIIPKNSGICPNPAAESKVGYIPLFWHATVASSRCACTLRASAGERSAGGQRAAESGLRGLPKLSKHDHLILKCPKTHEGAQLGLGPRYASSGDMGGSARSGAENRNQTIKCRRHKSNNQNPTNTTFPSHSFSESKQSKSRENPGKSKTLSDTLASPTTATPAPHCHPCLTTFTLQ